MHNLQQSNFSTQQLPLGFHSNTTSNSTTTTPITNQENNINSNQEPTKKQQMQDIQQLLFDPVSY